MGTKEVLLEFVQSVIYNRDPVINNVEIDWDELMTLSHREGVLAIVWDGINKLPSSQKPPRIALINWGLSAQQIREGYSYQKSVLLDMVSICDSNGLQMLLLKGVGLSELYPNPSSRESGDIDFYLFGEYKKGNCLFAPKKYSESSKHSSFRYKNVQVENHSVMINQICQQNKNIELYLENNAELSVRQPDGYYILPPIANIIFLIMHSIHHLCSDYRLPLRNLIDFVIVLNKYDKIIKGDECAAVLKKYNIRNHYELLVFLSEWSLKVDLSDYHLFPFSEVEKNNAYKTLIEHPEGNRIPYGLPYFVQLKRYLVRIKRMNWLVKYERTPLYYRLYRMFWMQSYILAKHLLGLPEGESFKSSFKNKYLKGVLKHQ